jgi:pyruvate,orthophosphate dikinase
MFLGEERVGAVRQMIFAETEAEEQKAYDALLPLQREDFVGIFRAMDGLPVTVRLLDPPLHEFLPNQVELAVGVARAEERGEDEVRLRDERVPLDEARVILGKVDQLHEANPMLGLRGVRLGLMLKDLYRMQARAATTALTRRIQAGGDPHLEIMIPLVAVAEELIRMREIIEEEIVRATAGSGVELDIDIGTMIELPRAALTAGEIALEADFFSFGTNDLTEQGILSSDPVQSIDRDGVGRLIRVATKEGREANPDLIVGLCGEHGGDPDSIAFVHDLGLDYVSCSPPRIEGARLAAAQAALGDKESANRVD